MSECNMFDGPKTDINLDIDETWWNSEPEKARFSNRTDADFCFSAEASVKGRLRTSGPAENGDHGPQHFGPSQGSAFFWSLWRLQGHCWTAEGCHTYTVTRIIWEFWFAVFEKEAMGLKLPASVRSICPCNQPKICEFVQQRFIDFINLMTGFGLSHRAHLSLVESAIWHLIALNFFFHPIGIPTLRFPHVVWNPPREGHLYRHGAMHRRRSSAVHGKDARRCKHRNPLCPVSRGICQYPRATICHLPRSHGKDIWQGNVIFARHTAEQILRALIYCLVARSYPKSQTNKGERSVKQSWKLDQSAT